MILSTFILIMCTSTGTVIILLYVSYKSPLDYIDGHGSYPIAITCYGGMAVLIICFMIQLSGDYYFSVNPINEPFCRTNLMEHPGKILNEYLFENQSDYCSEIKYKRGMTHLIGCEKQDEYFITSIVSLSKNRKCIQ